MNILLVIHEYLDPNSGSAGSTLALSKEYSSYGHQVCVISYDDMPSWINIKIKDLIFPVWLFFKLQQLCSEAHLDVIDASTGDIWVWALVQKRLLSRSKQRPLLVTRSHGLEHMQHLEYVAAAQKGELSLSWKYPLFRGSLLLRQVQLSLLLADLNFQLNTQDAKYAIEHLHVAADTTYVFPNGMPDSFLKQTFIATPTSKDAPIKIVQIGTYHYRKGVQYSIPALNNILQRFPQATVTFLGTDPPAEAPVAEKEILAQFAKAVRDRVTIIPHYEHDALPDLIRGHHIKLFPTLSEGFGKALVEAMACGLAPIATPAPGPMDVLTDGVDALIVPYRDSQAIEDKIAMLTTNLGLLDTLRRNAYQTAQNYCWHHIADQRLTVYKDAIAQLSSAP